MPPVREIDTSDGLRIVMDSGVVFHDTASQMQARLASYPGNLKKKEDSYNSWLRTQEPFRKVYNWDEYDGDHPTHIDPDNLPPWRVVSGAYVLEFTMFVAVHFYSTSPLSFVPRCQNRELGPITGEWW